MPIPLILGIIAAIVGGTGAIVGAAGVSDMREAKRRAAAARQRHARTLARMRRARRRINDAAVAFGRRKIEIRQTTIRRMAVFLETLGKNVRERIPDRFAGVTVSVPGLLKEFRLQVADAELASGGLRAATAGAAAGAATYGLVGLFGTASTGAAISGLSGAAANSAVVAWLGGGSLATGGGGMAVGTAVLWGVVLAPALLVGGIVFAAKGDKALTQARRYEAEVAKKIEAIKTVEVFIDAVGRRVAELERLAAALDRRTQVALDALEVGSFDASSEDHLKVLQTALVSAHALSEVLAVPVLSGADRLSIEGARVVAKYEEVLDP